MKERIEASNRRHGLFIAFHGILPTIFESQVLIHILEMRSFGIDMEVWVFPLSRASFAASALRRAELEQKYGVSIRLFQGFNPRLPVAAEILNALRLTRALHQSAVRPDFIHARWDYSAMVCGLVRVFFPFELIWDCRGDSVAEFGMSEQATGILARLMRFSKMRIASGYRATARRLSTKAIFVSELLKDRCLPNSDHRPVEVIPCRASEQTFFFSSSLRHAGRERMSIDSDQQVVVFVGSINYYQCFRETVELFHCVLGRNPRAVFLVLTPDEKEARDALMTLPNENYRLFSAKISQVNEYLNAADFSVFLRERNAVNDVASPVKFAEYCLAGLPVIMTDAVEQATTLGRMLGNAIVVGLGSSPSRLERWSDNQRATLAARAIPVLGRSAAVTKYLRLYGAGKGSETQWQS
jgi:hypothetical protein